MLAAVDVDYQGDEARAACVVFDAWTAARAAAEVVRDLSNVAPYEPGEFFRRELPCLLEVLGAVEKPLRAVVIDGYVWLDGAGQRPGLGAHLHVALNRRVAVVGVAKNPFAGAAATEVLRGSSSRPLFVTSVGMEHAAAVAGVRSMHGPHRIPTLLGRVDALARGRGEPNTPY